MISIETLQEIIGPIAPGSRQDQNAKSMLAGLDLAGFSVGLNKPHRLAQYLGQIIHESQAFVYDREVWGPTPAQKRYDLREDLGNTPEADGDGYKYRGRTPIQITGGHNYLLFFKWAQKIDHTAPDFVADPDAVNTDPWEGLGPIWFWSENDLNEIADSGSIFGVTRKINGGYNGIDDRVLWTVRASLVLLGFSANDVRAFQKAEGLVNDGIAGPRTQAALHTKLYQLAPIRSAKEKRKAKGAAQLGVAAAAGAGFVASFFADIKAAVLSKVCAIDALSKIISACGG